MNFKNIAIASLIMLLGVSMTAAGADLAHPNDDGCTDKGSNACGGGGGGSHHHSGAGGHNSGGSHFCFDLTRLC